VFDLLMPGTVLNITSAIFNQKTALKFQQHATLYISNTLELKTSLSNEPVDRLTNNNRQQLHIAVHKN